MSHSTLQTSFLKTCTCCGESKPLSDYHRQSKSREALRSMCKVCTNAQNRSIYQENRDSHLAAKRRYRELNPESRRVTVAEYERRRKNERAAWYAVKLEIMRGNLAPASERICAHCAEPASVYHHHSYDKRHWLDVIPLCRTCHGKEHRRHD